MKIIILFFLLSIGIQSCGQNKIDIKEIDLVNEIKHLKRFDYEPIYQIRINTEYSYTIKINGIPIANKYVNYFTRFMTEINSCIPLSGEQSIEIQIFPKILNNNSQEKHLGNKIDFELVIEETYWQNGSLAEPKTIYRYKLPQNDYTSQKTFKHKAMFKANVPYQLTDWRNGRIFKEEDSLLLKKQILKYYEKLKYHYENQGGANYVNTLGKGLFNLYQANYYDNDEALNHLNHKITFINKKNRELLPLENYKLEISGGGKLLSLRRKDGNNKEEGILRRHYKKGPKKMVQVENILFYNPQSSSINMYDFEVIWYSALVKGAKP